jgi:hypothetical protein
MPKVIVTYRASVNEHNQDKFVVLEAKDPSSMHIAKAIQGTDCVLDEDTRIYLVKEEISIELVRQLIKMLGGR